METDLTVQNLSHYIYCPAYYHNTKQSPVYSKRNSVNDATRRLFAWCFYELASERKNLSVKDIEDKAYKDLFPDPYSEVDMVKYPVDIHKLVNKILSKVGDYDIVSPSAYYPFAVAGVTVSCPIDVILISKNKSACWFFILDFNDKHTITATHNLAMPSVIIPYNSIPQYFSIPKNQVRVYTAKLSTGKLTHVRNSTSGPDSFEYITNLVNNIKENRVYKRVSAQCDNCVFQTSCFPSIGSDDDN